MLIKVSQRFIILLSSILLPGCLAMLPMEIPLSYGEPQLFNIGVDKTIYLNVFEDLREDKTLVADHVSTNVRTEQNIAKFISNALATELAATGYKVKKLNLKKNETITLDNELFIEGKIPVFLGEAVADGWYAAYLFTIELDINVSYSEQNLSKKYLEHSKVKDRSGDDIWDVPDRYNEAMRIALRKVTKRIVQDIISLTK